ncbi:alkyl sulfatase C-terminal domain-containing protein, partial [Acinetobacter baumannii]
QEAQGFTPPNRMVSRLGLLIHTPTEKFLEAMATNLDVETLKNKNQCMNLVLTDTKESFALQIENSVMLFEKINNNDLSVKCPTLALTKVLYLKIITGEVNASKLLLSKESKITGNPLKIAQFFSSFKKPAPNFPLIT